MMRDARAKSWVGLEETFHAVRIACKDHRQIVTLVLHHLQENLDRLLSVVLLILWPMQVVRLVDEEHTAHGALQYVLGLGRGVSDVLTDEVVARHGHQMPFANEAQ